MLADAAQAVNGKLYILGGGWSVLHQAAPFAIALKIEVPWSEATDEHRLRLDLLDEDGRVVLGPEGEPLVTVDANFTTGIPAGTKQGTPIDAVATFAIPALPLSAGRYEWRLTIDDQGDEDWYVAFTRLGD